MKNNILTTLLNISTGEKLLFFIIVWLSLDFAGLGKFSFISMGDNGDVILPGLMANKSLGYGSPYWHVFSTSGIDRFSQGFFGALDDWLFGYLPGWLAYQIRAISQIISAVLGTYILCRRNLGFSILASAVSGILYAEIAVSGRVVQSVMAYLPLSILALSLVLDKPSRGNRWAFLVASGLLISLTAYLSRLAPFLTYTHFLWFIFIEPKRKVLDWAVILLYSLIVVALRAPDYLAAITYGLLSHRHAAQFFGDRSLTDLAQNNLPNLTYALRFMAHIYLLLALVFCWKTIDKFGRIVAALIAGVLISGVIIIVKKYAISIFPLLVSFDFGRLLGFLWLFIAIGAGSFVFYLEKRANYAAEQNTAPFGRIKKYAPALAIMIIFAGSLDPKFKMVKDWISQGSYVHAFESPVLKNLAQKINRETIPVRVSTFQVYPNLLHPYGIETVGGYQALHLKRFNEYWSALTEPSASNITGDRLMLNPAIQKPEWDLSAEFNVNLLSLANMKYIVSRDRLKASNLKPVREIARPWHSLTTIEKIKTNFVENFTGRTSLYIYENTDVFPRFFFAKSVRGFDSATSVLDALKTANIDELEQTVFLEKQHLPSELAENSLLGRGKIKLRQYSPDELKLDVEITGNALMVVTNGYSPYWSAEIDGQPAKIFPVYHTFWGIHLPKSARKITFKYKVPWDWQTFLFE